MATKSKPKKTIKKNAPTVKKNKKKDEENMADFSKIKESKTSKKGIGMPGGC